MPATIAAPAAVEVTETVPVAVFPGTVVNAPATAPAATTLYARVVIGFVPAVPAAHVILIYGGVGYDTEFDARVGAAAIGDDAEFVTTDALMEISPLAPVPRDIAFMRT